MSSRATSYAYDIAGWLAAVTLPAASGGNSVVGSYKYFGTSALSSVSWNLGATVLASATYSIDSDGNRLSRATTVSTT